jgi:hypothetical protein
MTLFNRKKKKRRRRKMSSRQRARLLKVGKDLLADKEPASTLVRNEDDDEEEESENEQVLPLKSNSKRKKKDKRKLQKQIQSFAFSESEESDNDPEESSQAPEEITVPPVDEEHSIKVEQDENDDKVNVLDIQQEEVVDAEEEEAEGEEEEEDDQFTLTQKQTFVFESDDSQEEKSAESDSDQLNLALLPQKDTLPITINDDITSTAENKLLDDLIEQNQQFLSTDGKNNSLNELEYFNEASLLQLKDIDTKSLDLDNVVRARFGRNFDPNNPVAGLDGEEEERGGGRGGGGERRNRFQRPNLQFHNNNVPGGGRFSSSRKYLFGLLKEDWVKPLSFIGGGIGMTKYTFSLSDDRNEDDDDNKEETGGRMNSRNIQQKRNSRFYGRSSSSQQDDQSSVRNIFSFEYSKEYQQLTDDYEVLLQSNDPNYLIMFLVNYPYFIRGFYDLSLIYFQMGQIDKTLNLLRHCIFIYESSFLESFKVCYGGNYLPLDLHEENRLFYSVFMKYVQIITNQGYFALALDIVRIILALNPNDSTEYGLLLMLDYYCLMNKRYDLILNLTGVKSMVKTTSWNYYQYQLEMKKEKEEEMKESLKNNNDDGSEANNEVAEKKQTVPKPSMKELHSKVKSFSKKFEENIFTMIDHWKYSYVIDIEEEEMEEETGRTEEKNEKESKPNGEKNEELVQEESVEEEETERQFADDVTSVASSEVRSETSKKPRKGSVITLSLIISPRFTLFISFSKDKKPQGNRVPKEKPIIKLKEHEFPITIQHLPNWWFSLALSCFLGHEDQITRKKYQTKNNNRNRNEEDESNDDEFSVQDKEQKEKKGEDSYLNSFYSLEHATVFLLQAILHWPSVYLQIMTEFSPNKSSKDYQAVVKHAFFRNELATIK